MDAMFPTAFGFMLVLFRTAGLIMTAPIFSFKTVSARIRLGIALGLALAIFIGAGAPGVPFPNSIGTIAALVFMESAIGIISGLGCMLVLNAAYMAGHIAGLPMGFSFGAVVDPFNGVESNILQELLSTTAVGIAVAIGLHRELIVWLARSLHEFPVGQTVQLAPFLHRLIGHAIFSIALAIRVAVPIIAACTLANVAVGTLSKAVPQLSLQSVGFSVGIIAGGSAFYLVAPIMADIAARAAMTTLTG